MGVSRSRSTRWTRLDGILLRSLGNSFQWEVSYFIETFMLGRKLILLIILYSLLNYAVQAWVFVLNFCVFYCFYGESGVFRVSVPGNGFFSLMLIFESSYVLHKLRNYLLHESTPYYSYKSSFWVLKLCYNCIVYFFHDFAVNWREL